MKEIKNKKGFTLVELLAVIVILAVLVLLAVPSVLKLMDTARKNAFTTEAQSFVDGAKLAYAQAAMDGGTQTCFIIAEKGTCSVSAQTTPDTCKANSGVWTYAVGDFVDKNFDGYTGSVKIDTAGSAHKIWVSNGTYSITNGTSGSLTIDTTTLTTASTTCGA